MTGQHPPDWRKPAEAAKEAHELIEKYFEARPYNQVPYWCALTTDDAERLRLLLRILNRHFTVHP